MAERKQRNHAHATAEPAHTDPAAAPPQRGAGAMVPVGKGPTASDQAYGGLDGMSEEEQMKLQMAMERKSKTLETTSNVMHKMSDTEETITDNIK